LISRDTLLVEFIGAKSGKTFSTPVNYVRQGNPLFFTSRTDRTWWKNLRGGIPVRVWVQGRSSPQKIESLCACNWIDAQRLSASGVITA